MARFSFYATLLASIVVEADTREQAERKLRQAVIGSKAIIDATGADSIVATIEIEGELDSDDSDGDE